MSIENITNQIKQKMSMAAGLTAKVKFDFGDDGLIFVDTNQSPPEIGNEDKGEADVTLSCTMDTFEGILYTSDSPMTSNENSVLLMHAMSEWNSSQ